MIKMVWYCKTCKKITKPMFDVCGAYCSKCGESEYKREITRQIISKRKGDVRVNFPKRIQSD